jgi:hypothetical protein
MILKFGRSHQWSGEGTQLKGEEKGWFQQLVNTFRSSRE